MRPTATTQSAGTGRRITFLVALAVFAQEVTWNFYDAQVPPLLTAQLGSAAVVGLLMGMDNILGVFVQPWIGSRSDNTRTSWGRRMPYLMVGMPLAAGIFLLIPFAAASLPLLVAVMFGYALVVNSFRPVAEALVPDFVRPERRSRANAVVKIASALTIVVAAVLSLLVVDDHPTGAFFIPSAMMLAAVLVLGCTVRDSRSPGYQAALAEDADPSSAGSGRIRARDAMRDILRDSDRSRLLVILAIAAFGGAWAASRSLVTPYGMNALDLSRGEAGGLTLVSGIAYILLAYPLAMLAERVGRLKVILAGMGVFCAALVAGTVLQTQLGTIVALSVAAVGAGGFIINAAVVLWNLAPSARVLGTYAGLYNVSWAMGGFLGPTVVGAMVDVTGWRLMLVDVALVTLLAIAIVSRILVLQGRRAAPTTEGNS
ncbi:MFS transporter [Actinophytocola xanthii]|uniref:MFS transporter n=1 Tax=Actinophytocola xanthii TaxID=1912961 RepID=A0A1Q8CGT6_9PSEU|nr:MFS transporter [Actinophytocola xanthii]OLF13587.1 MFS transporter [Actinophytocola xanthii]